MILFAIVSLVNLGNRSGVLAQDQPRPDETAIGTAAISVASINYRFTNHGVEEKLESTV